jgi:DNA processing protein
VVDALRRAARARSPGRDGEALARDVARAARILERARGRAVARGDPEYPPRLLDLSAPPPFLYLAGAWNHHGATVAIVGSRHATDDGRDVARSLAADLARGGAAVVSGLARGIDAAAHEGALEAGGRSGAVLGTSLERRYPRGHETLHEALEHSLGLMSELFPGAPASRSTFAARNRLVAALADAVVVVQGREASGALLTVRAAETLGRPVGAVPWDSREPLGAAPHALIRAGRATLVRNAEDVWAMMALGVAGGATGASAPEPGPSGPSRAQPGRSVPPAPRPTLSGPESRVLAALRDRPQPLDDVAARADLPASEAGASLVALELLGLARREPGGRYRRARLPGR